MIRIVLALALLTSCTHAQAPRARQVGEVLAVGGVIGLIGAAATSRITGADATPVTAFSIISFTGIVTYAAGELSETQRAPARESDAHRLKRWARILTERAQGAARDGRCPRVRRLEKRVQLYDPVVHDVVFMRDVEILRCLTEPPVAAPQPPAAPEQTAPP